MPTTHVEPNSEALLQEIANSLYKARKVVVITGAGISTNSGIPDFRSENGLYSLIQAQFDAAAAEKQNASQESETSADRPPKRLRIDPQDVNGKDVSDSELPGTSAVREEKIHDSITVTTPRSKMTNNNGQHSDRPPHFQTSPPTLDFSHLRDDRGLGSSPLSSPPPVLLDPYRDSSTSRSSRSGSVSSSDSDSEDPSSVSTPFLTSQSSFSTKNTLPNMKGKDLFDAQIWSCPVKTSVFYTFATTLRHKVRAAEPTSSHHFVSVLRDSRKLVRCYTQNIDQLEERVGLATSLELGAGSRHRFSTRKPAGGRPKDAEQSQEEDRPSSSQGQKENECPPASQPPASQPEASQDISSQPAAPNRGVECVFLHGSLAELRCFVCARTASWDDADRQADTLAGRQPNCPHCAGATAAREERGKRALGVGKLRPDIVLYGEEHPHAHLISPLVQHDLSLGPDMLLILGTSMRVHGLKVLVKEFAKAVHDKGGKVVFVNFTKPPDSVWSDVLDFWVQWDCDAWVGDLQNRKPALWLPPGTVLPEEEKAKASRARTSGGGETSKRKAEKAADKAAEKSEKSIDKDKAVEKDNVEKDKSDKTDEPSTSNRRRESDNKGLKALVEAANTVQDQFAIEALSALKKHKVTPEEMRQQQESTETIEVEMPPPPAPVTKTAQKRPTRAPREPKLNPDAKRPASVRDHKNNAAHLVWRIMSNLEVIRNLEKEVEKQVPVPAETTTKDKSKAKKKKVTASQSDKPKAAAAKKLQPNRDSQPPVQVSASDAGGNVPEQDEIQVDLEADSITAAVKTRKRKRNVTWKMIRGVETRVSLDTNGTEVALPPPHHPHATAVPVNIPFKAPQRQRSKTPQPPQPPASQQTQLLPPATIPKNRALPKPKPQAPRNRTNSGASIPPHTAIHTTAIFTPKPLANLAVEVVDKYDAGFEETDRLIARYHELASNSQSRASTRASSPQPRQTETPKEHQLPPLNMRNLNSAQTTVPSRGSTVAKGGRKRSKTGPANGLLKLQVLEPKFDTPGPLSENVLSPNVGSPPLGSNGPRGRMGSVHQPQGHNDQENQPPGQEQHGQPSADQQGLCQQQQHQQIPQHGQPTNQARNPFFYSDPLASQLSFPPRWGDQQEQQPPSQYQQGPSPANYPTRYWSTTALDMFFRPSMDAQKQPSQEQDQEQNMGLGIQEPAPAPTPSLETESEVDDPWIEAARRVRQRLPMGGDLGAAALAQLAVQGAPVPSTLPFSTVLPARGVPARFYTPFQAWQQQRLEDIRQQGLPMEQNGQLRQAVGAEPGSMAGSGPGPGPGQGRWPPGWSAEEQLRQEAAMMLSSMRGSA
ncbi:hypothetical protein QR685DRAFT_451054 [Neurospora intermedia]|uniref:Deacetylase sirtuin-type domain-containing protein n=1 Tax=Neurospora intermedia TaxID=5142 RepID=A0ABR3D0V0_NEUIN